MCGSNCDSSSSRIRYESDAGAPPSSLRWWTKRTGVRGARPRPKPMLAAGLAMNVLHISESDAAGGAGRAAYRLHDGLRSLGHGSRMLVGRKVTADADTRSIKRTPLMRALDRACGEALDRLGLQYVAY